MATFTGAIGTGSKWLLDRIVGAIAATGINPNLLTFLGLVVNFGAAASFAVGNFRTGAIINLLVEAGIAQMHKRGDNGARVIESLHATMLRAW